MSCVDELQGLGAVRSELDKRGGRLIAASTETLDAIHTARNRRPSLPVLLASDTDASAIQSLGIVHQFAGKTFARPTTLLVDKEGIIRWAKQAEIMTDRPLAEVVLKQVQALP